MQITKNETNCVVSAANEVVTKADVVHADKVKFFADKIVEKTALVGSLYLGLCLYIRENSLSPKLVSAVLGERGFSRPRIAEINRVSNAADAVWNKFLAGTIGFRGVLELARGNVIDSVAQALDTEKNEVVEGLGMVDCGFYSNVLGGPSDNGLAGPADNTSGDALETDVRKFERLCNALFKLAEQIGFRKRTINGGNGYKLCITRGKKVVVPVATFDGASDATAAESAE